MAYIKPDEIKVITTDEQSSDAVTSIEQNTQKKTTTKDKAKLDKTSNETTQSALIKEKNDITINEDGSVVISNGKKIKPTGNTLTRIKNLILKGKELKHVADDIQVPLSTLEHWYYNDPYCLRRQVREWRHTAMIERAEKNLNELSDDIDPNVKFKATQFILERLDKDHYSSKSDIQQAQQLNVSFGFKVSEDKKVIEVEEVS